MSRNDEDQIAPADVTIATPDEDWDYRAFISYSHRDARWARWLHKGIETYRLPSHLRTRRGLGAKVGRLFLDRSELSSSASLAETIKSALARSRCLVVVCSPASAASRWVNEEIRLFRSLGRSDRIFCLVVDGEPGSTEPASQAFPPALIEPDPGGAGPPAEPLAADVRPGQDRPADAKLKIIAGLLDVSFDDLRQRDARRRQRQYAVVAAVSLVLMLTMLALTIAAVLARNQAERQTLTALRTTDFLKQLFKVSDPDEAQGRQVTAREMLDKGVIQISQSAELRDQPTVRAELLTTLAEVYSSLGLYRSSEQLAVTASRIADQPAETRAMQALFIAQNAIQNSDYGRAERVLVQGLRLVPERYGSARIRLLLSQGDLYKAMGRAADAERVLGEAQVAALHRQPPDRDKAIQALASLGGNDFESDNLDRAVTRLSAVIAQRSALSGPLHTEVLFALNTLGTVASKRGQPAVAEGYFRRTLALQRKTLGEAHPHVAITEANLARVLVDQGKFAPAAALVGHALAILARSNDDLLDSLANLYDTLGLAQTGLGRSAAAEASFAKGLRVAHHHQLAKEGEILVDLAELRCRTGAAGSGIAALDRAAAVYKATDAREPWRQARWSSVRGGCLLAAGQADLARPLIHPNIAAIERRWGTDSLFGRTARRLDAAVDGGKVRSNLER